MQEVLMKIIEKVKFSGSVIIFLLGVIYGNEKNINIAIENIAHDKYFYLITVLLIIFVPIIWDVFKSVRQKLWSTIEESKIVEDIESNRIRTLMTIIIRENGLRLNKITNQLEVSEIMNTSESVQNKMAHKALSEIAALLEKYKKVK